MNTITLIVTMVVTFVGTILVGYFLQSRVVAIRVEKDDPFENKRMEGK